MYEPPLCARAPGTAAFDLKLYEECSKVWRPSLDSAPEQATPGSTFAAIGMHPAKKRTGTSLNPRQTCHCPLLPAPNLSRVKLRRGATSCGSPDPSPIVSGTPKFRAPGKQPQNRLPGKVKTLRAVVEKEGEYPSSAGSPGSHVKVATPCLSQTIPMPTPIFPCQLLSLLQHQLAVICRTTRLS